MHPAFAPPNLSISALLPPYFCSVAALFPPYFRFVAVLPPLQLSFFYRTLFRYPY